MGYNSGRTGDATKTLLNQVDANALKLGPLADINIPNPLPYIGEDVIVLGANNSNCLVKTTMNGMANKYGIIHFDNGGHAKIEEATNILNAVQYTAQSLTTPQQEQARTNIGAGVVDANPANYFVQDYFIVGDNQGSWTVASSTMKPTDSSTSWSTSSDINVPTMKAISDYISSLHYSTTTGTVTSVRVQAGTGLSSSQSTAQSTTLNTTISVAPGYQLVDENDQEFSGTKTFTGSNENRTSQINNTQVLVQEVVYTDPEDIQALVTTKSSSATIGQVTAAYTEQQGVIQDTHSAYIQADANGGVFVARNYHRQTASISADQMAYGAQRVVRESQLGSTRVTQTYQWPFKSANYIGTIAMVDDVPTNYIKSASVANNTLTLTREDDTTIAFSPSGSGLGVGWGSYAGSYLGNCYYLNAPDGEYSIQIGESGFTVDVDTTGADGYDINNIFHVASGYLALNQATGHSHTTLLEVDDNGFRYKGGYGIGPNFAFMKDPLTNQSGKALTAYHATNDTIGGYQVVKIRTSSDVNLTLEQASSYMKALIGNPYVPQYSYNNPAYTTLVDENGDIYKPQWDSTNGLLLYKVSNPYVKKAEKGYTLNITSAKQGIVNGGGVRLTFTIFFADGTQQSINTFSLVSDITVNNPLGSSFKNVTAVRITSQRDGSYVMGVADGTLATKITSVVYNNGSTHGEGTGLTSLPQALMVAWTNAGIDPSTVEIMLTNDLEGTLIINHQ